MRTFVAENAATWAKAISYPRLVGTPAEVEARGCLRATLEGMGLSVKETPFYFYPVLAFGILKNVLACGAFLLLIHRILLSHLPRFGAALGLLLPLVANRLWQTYRRTASQKLEDRSADYPWHRIFIPNAGVMMRSANLIADLPVRGPIRQRLVFSAHTDSKSQNISIVTRAVLSILFVIGAFLLPFAVAPAIFWPGWLHGFPGTIWWVFWALAEIGAVILYFMKVTNESPGALDDAGACGVLLETARAVAADPPEGVAVRILLTGAEELGLAGAYHYAKTIDESPEWKTALHLNYEGAGEGTRLWLATGTGPSKNAVDPSAPAVELAERAAREAGLNPKRLGRLVGGEADHIPLLEAGLSAVTLMFSGSHGTLIHTSGDRPELIDAAAMDAPGRIALAAVRMLEEK